MLLTANKKEVPIAWSCSLMRDDSDHVAGIVAVGRDLTERRGMEEKLFQSTQMASLGVMAGGIAHELRNPLGIISASAQLLLENPRDTNFRAQGLQNIYAATRRASLIIENLLKFARPAGVWEKKEINLHTIIDEILALLSNQIKSQDVVVTVTYQPDLPHLYGSHQMLQQVFANLILNACNAMPEGGSLKITVEANSAAQVEIHLKDTGRGIPPENLSKIFDPFFTTMPVGKGVGLGLSISHTIIQQHQGVIEVLSEVGKGSDFIVRLPGIL
jgi:signal transduction histidine kinase